VLLAVDVGNTNVTMALFEGERLVAAEASDPRIYTGGQDPPNMISIVPRNGAIQVPSPTAIVKGSPHPNAAKLFAQFNLTPEIQNKFTAEGHHSPRTDVPPPPGLPRLDELTRAFGDRGYRLANLEAGLAGGRAYLAAYAQGFGASGLTFYDDHVVEFFSPHATGKDAIFVTALGRAGAEGRVNIESNLITRRRPSG